MESTSIDTMRSYSYAICDVFTGHRFEGNPLAVLPDAKGLSECEMQKIANEFNLSETTFVFPANSEADRNVRIFTPQVEVPFAGHPNLGTACILGMFGAFGEISPQRDVRFEEKAGMVSVSVSCHDDRWSARLIAPQTFHRGNEADPDLVAKALGLESAEINLEAHPPIEASVGLPFLVVNLKTLASLNRIEMNLALFPRLAEIGVSPDIFVYTRAEQRNEWHARMFAPLDGVMEDPATGSASSAFAGLQAALSTEADADFSWIIHQGEKMGRPSRIQAFAKKRKNEVVETGVAGEVVLVAKGEIFV